ncbi:MULTISPECIES: hypothetical protein [Sphingobacterium]|uniref:Lipoprotein n=1 Tax=Sphingobacterium populi TaxID=1812824 RepID=A0ABW5UEE5_9SPHI|nr:hypothetical protein [Sphingobacterium sp. CFCC 11742]
MKCISFILLILLLSCCQQIDKYKEDKAIQFVQEAKFGQHNLAKFGLIGLFINPNYTNLDMANLIADQDSGNDYKWIAKKSNDNNSYDVCFCEIVTSKGLTWNVNLESRITKFTSILKK